MRYPQRTDRFNGKSRWTSTIIGLATAVAVTLGGTGAANATTSGVVPLHNDSTNSSYTTGSAQCYDPKLDSSTSYWHFIVTANGYDFQSITLNVGGTTYANVAIVPNGSKLDNVFVAVPAGRTLNQLMTAGSSAVITPDPTGTNVKFVLSHLCTAPPPPVDVCTNIDGLQTEVPAGMVVNGGICTTPPPPTDVCTNIDGLQTEVPAGMIVNAGICTTPPSPLPPVDVCTNIDGLQTEVPAGMVVNAGICSATLSEPPFPAVVDVCANLAGDQLTVPTGFALVAGECSQVSSLPPTAPTDVVLPATGSSTTTAALIGFGLLLAGLGAQYASRRRTHTS